MPVCRRTQVCTRWHAPTSTPGIHAGKLWFCPHESSCFQRPAVMATKRAESGAGMRKQEPGGADWAATHNPLRGQGLLPASHLSLSASNTGHTALNTWSPGRNLQFPPHRSGPEQSSQYRTHSSEHMEPRQEPAVSPTPWWTRAEPSRLSLLETDQ